MKTGTETRTLCALCRYCSHFLHRLSTCRDCRHWNRDCCNLHSLYSESEENLVTSVLPTECYFPFLSVFCLFSISLSPRIFFLPFCLYSFTSTLTNNNSRWQVWTVDLFFMTLSPYHLHCISFSSLCPRILLFLPFYPNSFLFYFTSTLTNNNRFHCY